nr:putative lineage-restricted protein [Crepidula fornicata]
MKLWIVLAMVVVSTSAFLTAPMQPSPPGNNNAAMTQAQPQMPNMQFMMAALRQLLQHVLPLILKNPNLVRMFTGGAPQPPPQPPAPPVMPAPPPPGPPPNMQPPPVMPAPMIPGPPPHGMHGPGMPPMTGMGGGMPGGMGGGMHGGMGGGYMPHSGGFGMMDGGNKDAEILRLIRKLNLDRDPYLSRYMPPRSVNSFVASQNWSLNDRAKDMVTGMITSKAQARGTWSTEERKLIAIIKDMHMYQVPLNPRSFIRF